MEKANKPASNWYRIDPSGADLTSAPKVEFDRACLVGAMGEWWRNLGSFIYTGHLILVVQNDQDRVGSASCDLGIPEPTTPTAHPTSAEWPSGGLGRSCGDAELRFRPKQGKGSPCRLRCWGRQLVRVENKRSRVRFGLSVAGVIGSVLLHRDKAPYGDGSSERLGVGLTQTVVGVDVQVVAHGRVAG